MASRELQLHSRSETAQPPEPETSRHESNIAKKKKKNRTKKKSYLPRMGCFRSEHHLNGGPSSVAESGDSGDHRFPTHLVVMVNGIIGSAGNWKYAAKQFRKRYPQDILVHCSACNSSMLTFDGVDTMGERLAEEVQSITRHNPRLQKISFIGHSLGGLVARYAIGRLYEHNLIRQPSEGNGDCTNDGAGTPSLDGKSKGKIAGLEPMNFVTFATPHLGSRGHKQVPIFCGIHIMEKAASHMSWILSRTGKHLFLTDGDNKSPPLLLQMVNDCGDLPFISALQSFRRRVAYANTCFDHLVGGCTSSIRRKNELPKCKHLAGNGKYPHIVNVEEPKTFSPGQEVLSEAVKGCKTIDMEGLQLQLVKTYCINSDGADVILHVIDNFLL
ncbi:PREDICTED: putative lipase ROG1 isoform X2 [Nelumbo nucifera]|uniref:Lipase ROG1 isoform X2 n=1 Tax=Nelumbo nucifera TaxID=4432 RepID=A0A1U7ZCL0_NELNU|nr:PREDICTED: putative lipase ROG1 isoform X2 [Nelumbo nucifera]